MPKSSINLASLNGKNGFKINGIDANDISGFQVSGAGDINGDGIDDIIIGAGYANPDPTGTGRRKAGESYVVFGNKNGFVENFELSNLNGANGFKINGITQLDLSGISVNNAGDINGDGSYDLIIGAFGADPNGITGSGQSYVVFGTRSGFAPNLELSALDGSNGFKINGISINDASGNSVSSAGDINDDGIDDLIIGANLANSSYVVFGTRSGFAPNLELSALNGINGFKINGIIAGDNSGGDVNNAGDVNGDGIDDIIIGAPNADPNGTNSGQSYVVFGTSLGFASSLELSALNGLNGFKINGITVGDQSGWSVGSAGDVNGDGIDDIIIGAYGADPNGKSRAGQSYVVFGSRGSLGTGGILELSTLNSSTGLKINGTIPFDDSGISVSGAGDVNSDGVDDLIIGARFADPNGFSSGKSYVVFGSRGSLGTGGILELSALNGSNGFELAGVAVGDQSGRSVSRAGDINGDGSDDIIIGANGADIAIKFDAGQSYVVFGTANEAPELDLNGVNDLIPGFKINGIAILDFSGISVSSAGDINGDGIDDLIIGANGADPNGDRSGQSYVVFGRRSGFDPNVNLSGLDGINGFKINGIAANDYSSFSVSSAGDINGDGIDDLIIGASGADPNGDRSGQSYVVFGSRTPFAAEVNLSSINGFNLNGFKINGIAPYDQSGRSVSSAGDINGDGIDDLIIGANDADPNGDRSGQSYVVFGRRTFTRDVNFFELSGIDGFKINGIAAGDQSGYSVSSAGDINGDGIDDLIIGAAFAEQSYVVFGSRTLFAAGVNLSGLNGINGFKINGIAAGDYSGKSVSSAGDINGDGIDDLIIGAERADPNGIGDSGQSYVVFGRRTPFAADVNLSGLNGINGFKINGIAADDRSGFSVSSAGDINGDGIDDLIIGAFSANPNGNYSGQSYVVFGSRTLFAPEVNLSGLNGINGFKINGIAAGDKSGISVSSAGDINGDGIGDLIIGANGADSNGIGYSGQSYVVFGRTGIGATGTLELSRLAGSATDGIDFRTAFVGNAVRVVDTDLTLVDKNSSTLVGATITITNPLDDAAETLTATTTGTITSNYTNGILTLRGVGTIAEYQQVLRTITYNNTATDPNITNRNITFVVNDGATRTNISALATTTLEILALAPVVAGNYTDTASNDTFTNTSGNLIGKGTGTLTYGIDGGSITGTTSTLVGTYGTLSLETSNGVYSYAPNNAKINGLTSNQVDTFNLTVTNGLLTSAPRALAINITGANDTPGPDLLAPINYLNTAVPNTDESSIVAVFDRDNGQIFSYNLVGGVLSPFVPIPLFKSGTYGTLTTVIFLPGFDPSVTVPTLQYNYSPNNAIIDTLTTNVSETFTLSFSDGFVTTDRLLTININQSNDAPTINPLAPASYTYTDTVINDVFANSNGTIVGNDINPGQTLTYSVTGGSIDAITNEATRNGNYGTLKLNTLSGAYTYSPNATAINSRTSNDSDRFTFTVNDGLLNSPPATLDINIVAANDAPAIAPILGNYTDTPVTDSFADIIGTIVGTDRDTGSTLSYGILGGSEIGSTITFVSPYGILRLNKNSGDYVFKPNEATINALNSNTIDNFVITVNDGTTTSQEALSIDIRAVPETPIANPIVTLAAILPGNYTDTAANDSFANITGTLAATGLNLVYGITNGSSVVANSSTLAGAYGSLSIDTTNGAYTYKVNNAAINALTSNATDNFNFTVNDGIATVSQTFVVSITGANDPPTLAAITSGSYTDTAATDSFADITGTVIGADRDSNTIFSYGITTGTVIAGSSTLAGTYGSLSINTTSGAYTYKPNNAAINALNSNATDSFSFTVSDGTTTTNQSFAVNITGANDTPTLTPVIAGSYTDTAANDSFANITGTVVGADLDIGQTLSYSITNGTLAAGISTLIGTYGSLSLNTTSGAYTYVATATAINALSANASDNFSLAVSDGTATANQNLAINITGANDTPTLAPVIAGSYTDTAATDIFASITGTLLGTDRDLNNILNYGLLGSTVASGISTLIGTYGTLSLNNFSGLYTYKANDAAINALSANAIDNFSFTLGDGNTTTNQAFAINITGANDSPTQLTLDNNSIAENSPIGTLLGKFTTTDPDTGDSFTYSIAPNNLFSITGNELKLSASPNFETKSSHQISVKTTDRAGLSLEKPFTINITDIKESSILKNNDNKTFQVIGDQGPKNLSFQLNSQNQKDFTDIGFFKVDDDLGTINGIKPGDPGYLAAALDRFQIISSIIPTANLPRGFDGKTSRNLGIKDGDIIRFGALNEGSIDQLRQTPDLFNKLIISEPTTLKLTDPRGSGELSFTWQAPISLNLTAKIDNAPGLLGTTTPTGELLDFRQALTDITATFSIYREAAYNNNIYFYTIQNETGSVFDPTSQKTLTPTDAGYLQAALRNAVIGVNLSTPNQTITTTTATLNKGTLLAPIIVVNGTKDALLDNNASNDPAAYTSFILGNQDKVDHIRLLGDNTFGFEDLAGGGDRDYNDIIVKATFN
jgi:VCBS repeat-containing protein